MKTSNPFKVIGMTEDGKMVISGIMRFKETYGMPLVDIFTKLQETDIVVSWLHLLDEARDMGMNMPRFLNELNMAILEVYGSEYLAKLSNFERKQ